MLRNVCEDAFGEYEDKRKFLEMVKDKFDLLQSKIYDFEAFDSTQRKEIQYKLTLKKREYHIPEIRIPKTIANSEESDDSESQEEEFEEMD